MATGIRLQDIASCFEGVIPSPLCTCSRQGVPNVTYLSIVHRVGEDRVALSVQFFNKTRRNVRENPRAQVLLVAPDTMAQYRLDLEYERTDVDGTVFDYVRARLDAVASQSGMSHVFALRGVDIYRVLDCRPIVAEAPARHGRGGVDHLSGVAGLTARLSACRDLDQLVDTALDGVGPLCGGTHAFLMLRDEDGRRLFTLASRGFEPSGVGSEILIGQGLIGTAAERRVPVRNTNLARDRIFSRALRDEISRAGDEGRLEREIPLPGLAGAQSQLVVPLVAQDGLVGVLCLQSREPGRFLAEDEAAVEIVGRQLAAGIAALGSRPAAGAPTAAAGLPPAPVADGEPATVRYYRSDDSVFIGDAYLIKGLPGRLLHKLLQEHLDTGRVEFTNKELRLDPALKLPEFNDNLEARLILLRRRLDERCDVVRLVHAGRGRLQLQVTRRLRLEEHP